MAEATDTPSGFRFGLFEVDLLANQVRRNGLKVRLQEQPFRILALLLSRPGEVVTREELRRKLWPADTYVGFDHGLNNAINRLRDALGDSADQPRFVETVPRVGYRFLAPVEILTVRTQISSRKPGSSSHSSIFIWPTKERLWTLAALGFALTLVALLFPGARELILDRPPIPAQQSSGPGPVRKHLAVLPFDVVGNEATLGHIANGIAERITGRLARSKDVTVTSRIAVEQVSREQPIEKVARELGVNLVISASVPLGWSED